MGHGFRPLICKIEIKSPNRKGTKIANRNLLHYIATREGVDLTRINSVIDAMNENYDLTERGEAAVAVEAPDEEYLKYMTFRPRSHGLFGNIDTENFSDVSKKLDIASSERKTIYRGVISLSEMDGKALGYNNSGKWNLYLSSVMPDIASTLGISPNQMTWVAAFHAEQTHPHVHFMLWANQDQVKNAFITRTQQHKCREICQDAMFTDENEAIIRQITEAERKEIYKLQNASRNEITSYFKNIFEDTSPIPGAEQESMPGRLSREEHNKLTQLYKNILDTLPGTGRLHYKFMPPECKAYIDQVTELFLKRPDIKAEYNQYVDAVNEIHKILGKTKQEIELQRVKAINELYSRTGNIVLKGVLNIKHSILNPDRVEDIANVDREILTSIEKETFDKDTSVGELKIDFEVDAETPSIHEKEFELLSALLNENDELYNLREAEKIILAKLQEEGNEQLQFLLGKIYSNPNSILKDYEMAVYYFEEYVQNNPKSFEAYSILGRIYSEKKFSGLDYGKAEMYYQRAMEIEPKKSNFIKLRLSRIYANRESELFNYDAAIAILKDASDYAGSVSLQKGNIYAATGKESDAVESYQLSAEKDNAYAAFQLGRIYLNKQSSFYNFPEAVEYLEQAAGKVLEANMFLGKLYMSEASILDYEMAEEYLILALKEIQKKENRKDYVLSDHDQDIKSTIYFRLANIYAEQEAPQFDQARAIELYEQSISAGDQNSWSTISSRMQLAKIYANPESEYCDYQKAISLLEKAQDQSGRGMLWLGKIYADEQNPDYSLDKAVEYLTQAMNSPEADDSCKSAAFYRLGGIYSNETADKYDIKAAVRCYEQSISTGDQNSWSNISSRMKLARIYSDLQSPLCDFKKAIGFLKNIENKTGHVNYQMGEIYANKLNPNADLKIAVQYYEKALEASDISGHTRNRIETRLGDIYANEKFLEYDMKKALNFYKAAADNNDTTAMVKLAKCYLFGLGVESDKNMAKYWLEKASALGDTYANEYLKRIEDIEFKNFSYSMLRQIFSSMQKAKTKKVAQLQETEFRSSSKQARKEAYIHRN